MAVAVDAKKDALIERDLAEVRQWETKSLKGITGFRSSTRRTSRWSTYRFS
jgi:hypothetical protein